MGIVVLLLIVIAFDIWVIKKRILAGMNQQIEGLEALYGKLDSIERELQKRNAPENSITMD